MLILLLALVSCNDGSNVKPDGAKKIIKASASNSPDWIVMQKKHSDYVYFVGIGADSKELKEVRDKAVDDAVGQLVEYIGFRATSKIKKTTEYTDTDQASTFSESIKESIEGKGSAKVSVDIEDFYYEQYADSSFTMYVLLKLPKKWVEEERARLKQLAKEQRVQATAAIEKAKQEKQNGNLNESLEQSMSAYFISEQAVENSDIYDQAKNNILATLQGLSFKLENEPRFAFTEGGSEIIELGIYSSGSTRAVGGLLTSVDVEGDAAQVVSKSGFNSDKSGKVYLEVGKVNSSTTKELKVMVSFSPAKMSKIAELDEEFYQELMKVRKDMALSLTLKVGPRDKFVPTAVVILSVIRMNNKLVKPQFRPEVYERVAGVLANQGYNVVAVDIPNSILEDAREEKDLKTKVGEYLRKKYPTAKRMFYGIELILPAGKNVAAENTESAEVNVTMSLIDLETDKLEKSVSTVGRMWGNTFQQAAKLAEKKAFQKFLEKLAEF